MIENSLNTPQLYFQPSVKCPNCYSQIISSQAHFCSTCRYPLDGDVREQSAFERRETNRIQKYHNAIKKIERVKTLLKVLIWFMIGFGVVLLFFNRFSYAYSLSLVILGLIYFGLLKFFKRDTFLALISTLGFYVILNLITLSLATDSFFSGAIVRIVVVLILIQGIQGYKDFVKMGDELSYRNDLSPLK